MRFTGFIGPSYQLASLNVDCQRCVNMYPEVNALGTGKAGEVASLVGTPGLTLLVTLPQSPVRGIWQASNGAVYAVGGNTVYSISSSWVATSLGTINTTTGPVDMADNGIQLVIIDGTNGWYVTLSNNTLTQITDPNFLNSTRASFQDGYFLFNRPSTQTIYISNSYAVTFNSLAIGANSSSPDYLVAVMSANRVMYLFGTQHIECFYNSGQSPMPFIRQEGTVRQIGCAAAFSIAFLEGSPYWIGGDANGNGIVYRMEGGFQPVRISTPAIEAVIRAAGTTNVSNARAWTYQQGGHEFYCLNVPSLNSTWVYDASTGLWHERTFWTIFGSTRHLIDCAAVAFGYNIGGDYNSGNIYKIDAAAYTDNSTVIERIRTAPHIVGEDLNNLFMSKFALDLEAGVGLTTGQGSDPQVMLQFSDDGGKRYSNEKWRSAGAIGNNRQRARWLRLGAARDRVFRVKITDPVKVVLIGAEIDYEVGAA